MATPNFSALLPEVTLQQLDELTKTLGTNRTQVVIQAIRTLHKQEIRGMKHIRVGEVNDLHLYAMDDGVGGYVHLTDLDMNYEKPDAKIYYDSGIYPGVTDLPQYICNKASNAGK